MDITVFNVNQQQGFLVLNGTGPGIICAGFSRHTKKLFICLPYTLKDIEVPEEFKMFNIRQCDGFHLQVWTDSGYKDI